MKVIATKNFVAINLFSCSDLTFTERSMNSFQNQK
jgi:hypothetical protein